MAFRYCQCADAFVADRQQQWRRHPVPQPSPCGHERRGRGRQEPLCDLVHPECCDVVRENLQQVFADRRDAVDSSRPGHDPVDRTHGTKCIWGRSKRAIRLWPQPRIGPGRYRNANGPSEALKRAHVELERRVQEADGRTGGDERTARTIFRKLAEASEQGFGIADLQGRITYVNPSIVPHHGRKAAGGRRRSVVPHVCGRGIATAPTQPSTSPRCFARAGGSRKGDS